MKLIDLTGQKFGRLTVIERAENHITNNGCVKTQWLCECCCDNKTRIVVNTQNLRNGHTKSCGCLRIEEAKKSIKINHAPIKHGKSNTRLYKIWYAMKDRCYNPKNKKYALYGAENKQVCDEWQEFEPFYEWAMENGYKENLTIERIDGTKGYNPKNCKWASYTEQNNNKRDNHYLTYNGETKTIAQWAREKDFPRSTIDNRLRYGWNDDKILSTPK